VQTSAPIAIPIATARLRTRASVAICVATYRRPAMLRELLAGIARQVFRKVPAPDISVIVVDNDPETSAEEVCASAALPWPLTYVPESRRGIAQARNRTVREAGNVDFIAFIDDDEYPSPAWLDELLWTQIEFAADIVSGAVLPDFEPGVPEWVRVGMFFNRALLPNGQRMDKCHTGNVLVRRALLEELNAFDERFALTGGEDTQFLLRARRSGSEIVYSSRAVVHEPVPRSRGNLRWVLHRAYQSGNSWVLCEISIDRRLSTKLVRLLKACGWIAQGALTMPISALFGRAALARSLRNTVLGAGMCAALFGRRYHAYRTAGSEFAKVQGS
jgi:succinoglycan biosynthesis protein ExoM